MLISRQADIDRAAKLEQNTADTTGRQTAKPPRYNCVYTTTSSQPMLQPQAIMSVELFCCFSISATRCGG